jgi:putative aldouronate transport system substrate-binding protein
MKRMIFGMMIFSIVGVSLVFAAGQGQKGTDTAGAGGIPGDGQPLGKYNPPITVISAKNVWGSNFEPGDSLDDNPWTRKNREVLGINIKWDWSAPNANDQYYQKMTATIAAGNLPDIFEVNALQLDMLVQSGLVWDLTDIFEKYATPLTRSRMATDQEQLDIARFNNRLMAIPNTASTSDTNCIFVRKDWLDRLGLQPPATLQDVIKIAEAFATKDPDGNGKNDTIGLLLARDMWKGIAGRTAEFLEGYHAYPDGWIKNSSGELVYGAIQPEMKTALASLADLYKKGYVDQEFAATDNEAAVAKIVSGKAGLLYGAFPLPLQIGAFEAMNPNGLLLSYPIVSADSNPVKVMVKNPVTAFFVVNKKFSHPEALIKLMNLHWDMLFGPNADRNFSNSPSGYEYWMYNIYRSDTPHKNVSQYRNIATAIEKGDTSTLNAEEADMLRYINMYLNGERENPMAYGFYWVFGNRQGTTMSVMDQYVKNNSILLDAFYGHPTETMTTRLSSLESLRDEVFTKIIMGASPISAFDAFVSDWKRQGGDDITREVNAWYKSRQ